MNLAPLEGLNSFYALQAYHTLMLGLKMLPMYLGETYEEFFAKVEAMPSEDQEKLIREAALFVKLEKDEISVLSGFYRDANGVPYNEANLKSLAPDKVYEIIVAVCTAISKIKINFVTKDEKKN